MQVINYALEDLPSNLLACLYLFILIGGKSSNYRTRSSLPTWECESLRHFKIIIIAPMDQDKDFATKSATVYFQSWDQTDVAGKPSSKE